MIYYRVYYFDLVLFVQNTRESEDRSDTQVSGLEEEVVQGVEGQV